VDSDSNGQFPIALGLNREAKIINQDYSRKRL